MTKQSKIWIIDDASRLSWSELLPFAARFYSIDGLERHIKTLQTPPQCEVLIFHATALTHDITEIPAKIRYLREYINQYSPASTFIGASASYSFIKSMHNCNHVHSLEFADLAQLLRHSRDLANGGELGIISALKVHFSKTARWQSARLFRVAIIDVLSPFDLRLQLFWRNGVSNPDAFSLDEASRAHFLTFADKLDGYDDDDADSYSDTSAMSIHALLDRFYELTATDRHDVVSVRKSLQPLALKLAESSAAPKIARALALYADGKNTLSDVTRILLDVGADECHLVVSLIHQLALCLTEITNLLVPTNTASQE
ncbi:MAG TPA: hypothetical protein VGK19_04635 [Capsulimonadaceae bacterium]|jgi:hypothetical protein